MNTRIRRALGAFLLFLAPVLAIFAAQDQRTAAQKALKANRAEYTDRVTLPNGKVVDVGPTLDRIASGGTNPHRNDGTRFNNYPDRKTGKQLLPVKPAGFYTEFVHPTPGISHAGAQRIIVGRNGEAYYSPDHYQTALPLLRRK